jgi:hypothetical protein
VRVGTAAVARHGRELAGGPHCYSPMGRDLRLSAAGYGQHCHEWLFFLKEFDWGAPECERAVSAAR